MKHVEVVCAVIKDKEGKYFCCKRGPGRALEGFWEFPGGKIEINETHEMTIIREIKEELNSNIKPIKYITTVNHTYEDTLEYKGFSITMHAYLCLLEDGLLEISEHTEKAWKTKEEMLKMKFAQADTPILLLLD